MPVFGGVHKNMYEIFAKLLQERGITAYRVSMDTGVPQSTLSGWKQGVSRPKYESMRKIADYFGVTVAYLAGEEDDTPSELRVEAGKGLRRVTQKDLDHLAAYYAADDATRAAIDLLLEKFKQT